MKIKIRTIALLLALIAAGATAFITLGIYNIAATAQHTGPVYWLMEYAMRKSVQLRSAAIPVPALNDAQHIYAGMLHYRAHCQQCHGAPGIAPDSSSLGMTPAPANLVVTAREWGPAELYWVIRYGIKMSGMPAWEYRLSDQEIWDIVAFVERLPAMPPSEYQALSGQSAVHVRTHRTDAAMATNGDASAGKRALQQYLCATCHHIPGIVGAIRHVGPPLNGIAGRKYIGGVVPNTPENMVRWLQDPKQFDPQSAMPDLGVTDKDARDIAAFLLTLEDLE